MNTPGPPSPLNVTIAYFHSVLTACSVSFSLMAATEGTPVLLSLENKVAWPLSSLDLCQETPCLNSESCGQSIISLFHLSYTAGMKIDGKVQRVGYTKQRRLCDSRELVTLVPYEDNH